MLTKELKHYFRFSLLQTLSYKLKDNMFTLIIPHTVQWRQYKFSFIKTGVSRRQFFSNIKTYPHKIGRPAGKENPFPFPFSFGNRSAKIGSATHNWFYVLVTKQVYSVARTKTNPQNQPARSHLQFSLSIPTTKNISRFELALYRTRNSLLTNYRTRYIIHFRI